MGINAQTSVPKFTSGDVLTAANTNLLTNAPPVFGGTATRDAAFGGAGEKTLAEGQLCYLEDSNIVQYYDGAAWLTLAPTASGLVPVIPTSVAVGSGTGSVGASGLITFSGVSSVSINGCFTSAYTNYRVVARYTNASTLTALYCRLRAAGVNATTNYDTTGFRSFNNLAVESNGYNTDVQQYANTANVAGAYNGGIFDFFGPAEALSTNFISTHSSTESATAGVNWFASWYNDNQTSYDGFTISCAASTLSGTLMVYGYSI